MRLQPLMTPPALPAFPWDAYDLEVQAITVAAIIVAGGTSSRMGGSVRKPYIKLCGAPLLSHALHVLSHHPAIAEVCVVHHPDDTLQLEQAIAQALVPPHIAMRTTVGGSHRGASVWNGLQALQSNAPVTAIHDAARPFINHELMQRIIDAAASYGAAVPVQRIIETLKETQDGVWAGMTVDRNHYVTVQTPQAFKTDLLVEAYQRALNASDTFTDDAAVVEHAGHRVRLVSGAAYNRKITHPEDIAWAHAMSDHAPLQQHVT